MEMKVEIYKNNELVETLETENPEKIYKEIALIFYRKEYKLATKTLIDSGWYHINKITQIFDENKTQIPNTNYKYVFTFEDVEM